MLVFGMMLVDFVLVLFGWFGVGCWGGFYGVLYWVMLQQVFFQKVEDNFFVLLMLGMWIDKFFKEVFEVQVGMKVDFFVGVDGVWLKMCMLVEGVGQIKFFGFVVWCFVIFEQDVFVFIF